MGIVACTRCSKAWPMGTRICGRCGHHMVSRDVQSLQKVWAFWLVGFMCYIPANMYPMLKTKTLFQVSDSTIVGGAVDLAHHGALGHRVYHSAGVSCHTAGEILGGRLSCAERQKKGRTCQSIAPYHVRDR